MGEEMSPIPQFYSDQFGLMVGPFGAALNFGMTKVVQVDAPAQADPVVAIRTSLEHLKAIAFVIHHQITRYQAEFRVRVEVPDKMLEALGTTRDEWERFWDENQRPS